MKLDDCRFASEKNIIFYNEENGYTIARFTTSSRDPRGRTIGNFIAVMEGAKPTPGFTYCLEGDWVKSKYGYQFQVDYVEDDPPRNKEDVVAFLSSGAIKKCGAATANLIFDKFGESTIDVFESEDAVEKLSTIKGISEKKAKIFLASYEENVGARAIIALCCKNNISYNTALKIYKRFGKKGKQIIENNPYRLIGAIPGIAFKKADVIAIRCKSVSLTSDTRVNAAIAYKLHEGCSRGDLFCDFLQLAKDAAKVLTLKGDEYNAKGEGDLASEHGIMPYGVTIPIERVMGNIQKLALAQQVIMVDKETLNSSITDRSVVDNMEAACFLPTVNDCEVIIAAKLAKYVGPDKAIARVDVDTVVKSALSSTGFRASEKQKSAIRMVLENKLSILTGGPGTGKTSVIKSILAAIKLVYGSGVAIALAAPTGKAARRMTESCGYPASTLHSLLGLTPVNSERFDVDTKLIEADVLIVDETSMVDVYLMRHLIEGLRYGTKVLFVGDVAQLPSVGPGAIFSDMIESGKIPTTVLTEIFRQSEDERALTYNAGIIRSGKIPGHLSGTDCCLTVDKGKFDFFDLSKRADGNLMESAAQNAVVNIYARLLAKAGGDASKVQVLTPLRKKGCPISASELNPLLQAIANPVSANAAYIESCGTKYHIGDRVMQHKNSDEVANGEVGIITDIYEDEDGKFAIIKFDDATVAYAKRDFDAVSLAYACTVHKVQGSEYDTVIMPIVKGSSFTVLSRALLYTGVTRARKRVVIVGQNECLKNVICYSRNNVSRRTLLKDRISAKAS